MTFKERCKLRSDELHLLADLLYGMGICPDISPLQASAAECFRKPRVAQKGTFGEGRLYWSYDVTNLRINLSELKHVRPVHVLASQLTGILTISVEEFAPGDDEEEFDEFGAIRSVQIAFVCDSYHEVGEGRVEEVRAAWHLDTHLFMETDSHSVHPHFHFQFGGEGLEGFELHGVFVPEQPRLAHPPLDAILAVDFVLSHYCGDVWKAERNTNARYAGLVAPACKRYWLGYYRHIAEFFGGPASATESVLARNLLPNLC